MCGQCGVMVNSFIQSEMNTFLWNLRLNYFRGKDSTGIVSYSAPSSLFKKKTRRSPQVHAWKEPRDAIGFLAYDDLDPKGVKEAMLSASDKRLMMGHCRAATVGKVTAKNAHPFSVGNIIGMHNGTIKKDFRGSKDYETDSEAFFALINEVGLKDALEEVESYSQTAYAIQYIDRSDNTFNVVRNSDRPLHFVYSSTRGALFWSSEEMDIRYAARKCGVTLETASFQPKPYQHMKFHLLDDQPHKQYDVTDLTPKKATTYYTGHSSGTTASAGRSTSVWPAGSTDAYKARYNHSGPSRRYDKTEKKWQVLRGTVWCDERPTTPTTSHALTNEKRGARYWDMRKNAYVYLDEDGRDIDPEVPIGKAEQEKFAKTNRMVFSGFQDEQLLFRDFERILMNGCANCETQPDINDPDIELKIGWNNHNTFLCEECCKDPNVSNFFVKYRAKPDETPEVQDVDPNEDT